MAHPPNVASFEPNDRFLRRVGFPDHIKREVVHWRAFKEKDATLSLTLQDESLRHDAAIEQYRQYWAQFLDGNTPGLLWLSHRALAAEVHPPLPPRRDPNPDDAAYGHLHCVIDAPSREQMELLSKLVNDGRLAGLLRDFVKRSVA